VTRFALRGSPADYDEGVALGKSMSRPSLNFDGGLDILNRLFEPYGVQRGRKRPWQPSSYLLSRCGTVRQAVGIP